MITITESSSWIAQHSLTIGIFACVTLFLALSLAVAALLMEYTYERAMSSNFKRNRAIALCIAGILFLITIGLFAMIIRDGEARYAGSAEYTVKQSETQSSGQQIITVNDSKSDVKLNVDDDGKTNYAKGDEVEVSIQSNDSANHGKRHLSDVLRSKSNKGLLIKTEYTVKKID